MAGIHIHIRVVLKSMKNISLPKFFQILINQVNPPYSKVSHIKLAPFRYAYDYANLTIGRYALTVLIKDHKLYIFRLYFILVGI